MNELEETIIKEPTFQSELTELLNKYSQENGSNTPDWILSTYIIDCLYAFNSAFQTRHTWYNAKPDQDVGV